MSESVTKEQVKQMISSAIANYDRTSRERHESTMRHLREIYGNGSGTKGYLERSFDALVTTVGCIGEWVDVQKRKAETAELLDKARVEAQVSRDKKLNRLLTYAKIGALLLTASLGKDWATHLFHSLLKHIH
jgi:hypothetical protein